MLNAYKLSTIIDIFSMAESVKVINGMGRYGGAGGHHRTRRHFVPSLPGYADFTQAITKESLASGLYFS